MGLEDPESGGAGGVRGWGKGLSYKCNNVLLHIVMRSSVCVTRTVSSGLNYFQSCSVVFTVQPIRYCVGVQKQEL